MVSEKTAKIYFGLLKSIILPKRIIEEFAGYPKLLIYDNLDGKDTICNSNLTVGISKETLNNYDEELVLESLAKALYKMLIATDYPYIEEDYNDEKTETLIKSMTVDICQRILGKESTYADTKNDYEELGKYKLTNPMFSDYWISMQFYNLRFMKVDKTDDAEELFEMLLTHRILHPETTVIIKEENCLRKMMLSSISFPFLVSRVESLEEGEYYDIELKNSGEIVCTANLKGNPIFKRLLEWADK